MKILSYSTEKYKFVETITNFFKVSSLENLHLEYPVPTDSNAWKEESSSKFHKTFYSKLSLGKESQWNELVDIYDSFVKDEIYPQLTENFITQKFPSFRVQLPLSKAINKWHFDSDHDHGHPEGEINIQIPLTVMYDTSATWIESIPGLKDFKPMNMRPGQYALFYGNKCMHGNKENETGLTRVSLDFRIINKDVLSSQKTRNSATLGVKFEVGGYYKEIK